MKVIHAFKSTVKVDKTNSATTSCHD